MRRAALLVALILVPVVHAVGVPANKAPPPATQTGQLTPEQDWVSALRAGGTLQFGPGVFHTTQMVQLDRSVTIIGSGAPEDTILRFDSPGGEFREQLALVAPEGQSLTFQASGVTFEHGGTHISDLITASGDVRVDLRNVVVALAWDDLVEYFEEEGDWWGSGLFLLQGASASVADSEFLGNVSGIVALNARELTVSGSTFDGNWFSGIYSVNTPLNVSTSHFDGNDVGIEVYGTAARTLTGNTFGEQFFQDVYEEE